MQANRKILTPLVEMRDKKKTVDMIMVGPVADEPQKVGSKYVCVFHVCRGVWSVNKGVWSQ